MKVAVFSTKKYDETFLSKVNKEYGHELLFLETSLGPKTVTLAQGARGVCVFVNDKIDKEVIDCLLEENVEMIALRNAGFNNVNVAYALEKGIKIFRVPAYSPHAVAEHAVALILTLNRKTHKAYNRVRESNFSLEKLLGFDLNGKTVGVIGTGKIGAAFCSVIKGFGTRVIAFDKYESDQLKAEGVEYMNLDQLFSESDIISLHCPLTPETHHIINDNSVENMKDGVMIINTSRGALIDTKSVIRGLKRQKIAYLGIDVYEQEESLFFQDLSETVIQDDEISRLMSFPNVLITAHQAFFTENALSQIAHTTLKNITDFEAGNDNGNMVTEKDIK